MGSGLFIGLLSRMSSVSYASSAIYNPQCAQFHNSDHWHFAHLAIGSVSAPTWFLDIGTNRHITHDLANLTDFAPYLGNDHLHIGDGKGLSISYIEHTML